MGHHIKANMQVDPILLQEWRSLAAREAEAPPGQRGGFARKRTELLANIPPWQLPAMLDMLSEEGDE
jgi:hypothetical protein